jgi:hypothetical protein
MVMQPWEYGAEGEEPGMKGWDVIIVDDKQEVKFLYAMIEGAHTHSTES